MHANQIIIDFIYLSINRDLFILFQICIIKLFQNIDVKKPKLELKYKLISRVIYRKTQQINPETLSELDEPHESLKK